MFERRCFQFEAVALKKIELNEGLLLVGYNGGDGMNFEGITIIERDFDNIVFDKLMKVKFVDSG